MNRWRLDGARAVVTGGTRGIGLATALELVELGATVLVALAGLVGVFRQDNAEIVALTLPLNLALAAALLIGSRGSRRDPSRPGAERASFSPDGKRLAYLPLAPAFQAWKRYRGGRTAKIWLADLADSKVEEIPRTTSNDIQPMWIGDKVWFLSDRNGAVTLFSYDTKSKKVAQALQNPGLDYKWASAGPDKRLRAMRSAGMSRAAGATNGNLGMLAIGLMGPVRAHIHARIAS